MDKTACDTWFVEEVLPLEPLLMGYLRNHWRQADELADLRQEIYTRAYDAALKGPPRQTKAFLFTIARNLIIDRVRRSNVVSLEFVADMEELTVSQTVRAADRAISARLELSHLKEVLDGLPPRRREVVMLRKVYGLSQKETAERMGITEDTVERQVSIGVRALADAVYGDPSRKKEGEQAREKERDRSR